MSSPKALRQLGRFGLIGLLVPLVFITFAPDAAEARSIGGDSALTQPTTGVELDAVETEREFADPAFPTAVDPVGVAVGDFTDTGRAYDYRPDFARPPPVQVDAHAYDTPANLSDPAADRGRVRRVSSDLGVQRSAPRTSSIVDDALSGGRHSGFLNNYAGRSRAEIQRGVRSIERQIDDHLSWIDDPYRKIPNWDKLDPRQQQALLTQKWPGDIQRQREQLEILRHLLDQGGR